jgi:acyl carrier protein
MSLDIVLLFMDIEQKFGVVIPDNSAERIRTVGDTYQFLLRGRVRALEGACVTSATFYRARRALCAQLGLERRSIAPSSALEELFPVEGRRRHWHRFCAALRPFALPGLRRPLWLRSAFDTGVLVVLAAACLTGLGACLLERPLALAPVAFVLLGGVVLALIAHLLTIPLAVCVPEGCGTMREFVRTALGGDHDQAFTALKRLSEREIWDQLLQIISDNLGVRKEDLTPDTSYQEDLGVD